MKLPAIDTCGVCGASLSENNVETETAIYGSDLHLHLIHLPGGIPDSSEESLPHPIASLVWHADGFTDITTYTMTPDDYPEHDVYRLLSYDYIYAVVSHDGVKPEYPNAPMIGSLYSGTK